LREDGFIVVKERLKGLRKTIGLTQKQLGEKAGIPHNTISRIELGETEDTSTKTLTAIARALNVSADYLLGLKDEPE